MAEVDLESFVFFDRPVVELVDKMGDDLAIAHAAWVSTMGEHADEGDPDKIAGLINFLAKNRHGSPFEHAAVKFRVKAPIFVWREHHRHRIASYNEESGRYKQLDPHFYIPSPERNLTQIGKAGAYEFVPGSPRQIAVTHDVLEVAAIKAYHFYQSLLDEGVAREVARMCLPVNIMSTCYVTMNLRALMNFLSLRTPPTEDSLFASFPQAEIAMVAADYEKLFADHFPITHAAFIKAGRIAP